MFDSSHTTGIETGREIIPENQIFRHAPNARTATEARLFLQSSVEAKGPPPCDGYSISCSVHPFNDYRCVRELTVDEEHGVLRKCVLDEWSDLQNEYDTLDLLFDAQVPVPKPLFCELVDGYEVLDMEYIQGKTLAERLEDIECEGEKVQFAEAIANKVVDILRKVQNFTHHEVSQVKNDNGAKMEAMTVHEYLQRLLRLYTHSPTLERKFMELMPDESAVLAHGIIYDPSNVLITDTGEVVLLNWERAGYYFKGFDAWMLTRIHISAASVWTSALIKKMNVPHHMFKMAEILEALWHYGAGDPDPSIRHKRQAEWWPRVQEAVGEDLGDQVDEVDYEALDRWLYTDLWRDIVTTTGDLFEDTQSENGLEWM